MEVCVVIPTLDARELLLRTLASLHEQTAPAARIVVVDNASGDGTAQAVRDGYPAVEIRRLERNHGFGRAINRGLEGIEADVLVLVNNDVVCEPSFLAEICAPLADPRVGMVAGVLLQEADTSRIDTAGIEVDPTLRAWEVLPNEPLEALATAPEPIGPCGGAAAYRLEAFRAVGGFDEAFFAYWEDVDLALRLRLAGWTCRRAEAARAVHRHSGTLGAVSPAVRRLDAFGRGYVLARYRVCEAGLGKRAAVALVDWPAMISHIVFRRELGPLRARLRGQRAGRRRPPLRPPFELASISLASSAGRQWVYLADRLRGRAPKHYYATTGVATRDADGRAGAAEPSE